MITLERPSLELISSYLEMIEEMRKHGDRIWESMEPQPDESEQCFVQGLLLDETQPKPGRIAETHYWGCENGTVVGRISIRHALDENLKQLGGHVGFMVRPSRRNQGVANHMLHLLLKTPFAQQVGEILLTCEPKNIASNKTIVANGGVFKGTAYVERFQRETNYYLIDLNQKHVLETQI